VSGRRPRPRPERRPPIATPPAAPLSQDVWRWRAALYLLFLLTGVVFASWITRTPTIRDAVGASTAQMGLILLGLSVGAMTGILTAPRLVTRYGGRPVTAWGGAGMAVGLAVVACATAIGAGWLVAVGLALLGAGTGSTEIAQNVEGAAVERTISRPVLPALHGCFSLGTVLGAGAGIALNAARVPVPAHLFAVAVLMAAAVVWTVRHLPPHTGREAPGASTAPTLGAAERRAVFREPRVLMLGAVILGMALAEGAASDWLPLITVDDFGLTAVSGSVVYTVFATAMTAGRLGGGAVLHRAGRSAVLRSSAALAAAGIAAVVLAPTIAVAGVGVVLWGLGASLGFPVALSAAGDDPRGAATRVGAVATAGYLAFLVGPPVLGALGEHLGLRHAMVVVLAVVLVAGCFTSAVRPQASGRTPDEDAVGAPVS
jgi:fucose permease